MRTELSSTMPVAIIGMGCRFPGIGSVDDLWDVLIDNTDTVTPVPHDRFDVDHCHDTSPMTPGRTVSRHGGFLTDPFGFDAAFFGVSPAEARDMDPQQRLLLHVVWEALESAGIRPSRLAGSRSGVFVGQATSEYADTDPRADEPDVHGMVGSRLRAVTAGRVSYALDLRGPSVVLDTACSSSLVAVHAARQSLLTGESDLCVAAGVNIILSPHDSIAYSQGDMLSPGGRCRFGDARADGFVRSEGVGVVVLKRLDDALRDNDPVRALLLGSAVTNDGAGSGLLLRPSVEGQADMLREACASAGVKPSELDYVEAHGTGTRVGDAVELRALAESAGQGRAAGRPLLTGSVKTNIGHAEAAAGIAGLIKTVLILRHGVVPASLHLDEPHPLLGQDGFPVRVVTRNQPLTAAGPRALLGVSSFGLSGTNAHVVVGAHVPEPAPATDDTVTDTGPHLLVLSARTAGSLRRLAADYAAYLGPTGAGRRHRLRDICAAAATGRDPHPHRLWVVGDDHDSLSRRLRALADGETLPDGGTADAGSSSDRRIVFVFSGQGAQWAGMGRTLYRSSPAFRSALDACDRAVRGELGWSVLDRLTSDAEFPTDVDVVQPVLWAVQVALAAAWRERGVQPHLCMGHSMGEVAAAHVSGALSLDEAAAVICRRSRLMQRTAGRGAMLVVELSAARARQRAEAYGDAVCVAAENAPTTTVLAGDPASLAALRTELERDGVLCRPVKVNVASHSPQMDAVRDDLLRELSGLSPTSGGTGMVSTVYGHEVEGPQLTAAYWVDNLRRPVRFADALRRAAQGTDSVFLEVGPHPVLLAAMDDTLGAAGVDTAAVASLYRAGDEPTELARAAGRLFAHGGWVDWRRWYGGGPRHVPSLPTYSWDAVRYRRDPAVPTAVQRAGARQVRRIDLGAWGATADWGDGVAVHGVAAVPPVAYLAAMLETAQEADRGAPLELRDVRLGDACVPLDAAGDTVLHVALDGHRQGGGADPAVTVRASVRGAPDSVLCASGRIVRAEGGGAGPVAPDTLDAALARCRHYLGAQDFPLLARRHGHDIAEPFRGPEHLWRRDGEAVARVRLAKPLPHVGWETGLQTILAARPGAVSGRDDAAHVPVSFDAVRFHAELEPEFWSLSTVRAEDGGAFLLADVLLIAPDRRVLARFSGIRLRRLAQTSPAGPPLARVSALVPAVTQRCAVPLTHLARKVAGALGAGAVARPPRPAAAPRFAGDRTPAAARTATDAPSRASAPSSRPRRAEDAAEALVEYSAALLGMRASDIDERLSLRELGLDSLMATRLRQHLQRGHGTEITAGRLLGTESIADLRRSLVRHGAQP
ncbi:beta-ketoacyl synthase N-terminal-like domain-containing protein [Streptomyces sp. TG1A-8]|uniref:type I polyketide synthase n=1 Tax=Streptomyces sp. TG1A-8 TaxID=3051385 RepID=UPI00265C18C6|nr:beta-ketoacyl synthase N-terminal-like domain-containing protein [Streptomyces sp. TG1A-8]MDO0929413.1 beta-ketoacyl synthase N-terminal-like domain-containing protein [Streptomyces sp. TG1A-8]